MTGARNLLQTAVVKTNRVFPFSYLYRAPYWLAVHSFAGLCGKFPEVRGVYLRHGMAERDWVPGISDIDMTVTFSAGLSLEREFSFLSRLRARQKAWRQVFPMLMDVVVLEEDHLGAWSRFGIQGFEAPQWKMLKGEPPACGYCRADSSTDAIDDALYRYFEHLLVRYFEPASYLSWNRMLRLSSRILRHAPEGPRQVQKTRDPALLVARVLLALDRWLGATDTGGDDADEETILIRHDVHLVVPGEPLTDESVRQCLIRLRDSKAGDARIRVATNRILRHWFRVWHPRQYHDWMEDGRVVRGPNVLARIEPPREEAHIRSLLNLTGPVLAFPQLESVVLQNRAEWFAGEEFRWLVQRGWYLRLYLEHGIYWPRDGQAMRAVAGSYPESVDRLAEIQKAAVAGGPLEHLQFQGFRLLKETAVAVGHALAVSAGDAPRPTEVVGV